MLMASFMALAGVVTGQRQQSLFDGSSLAGWETVEADRDMWSVVDGAIHGGSLERRVPHNSFLATTESYANFDLRLSILVEGSGGLVNSGVQIRSQRVAGSSEMKGYQVDAGDGWWGKLYDESRRNRVIAESSSLEDVVAAAVSGGWNDYRILAEGRRIRSWINGVAALDYEEVDREIPLDGHIAIQVHSGERVRVRVKDVSLTSLAASPDAMTWKRLRALQDQPAKGSAATRTAAEELAGFSVLDGFEVELVASDPEIGKIVDIAFDDAGRLWAVTAVEYPLDANESDGVLERFRAGGQDRVLVFDEPWSAGPHRPRVFADGLFMPMAVLPFAASDGRDSVLIGHGPDILKLIDDDKDGVADRRERVLTGFGVQDSHLLPHRFVRAPGDWIYMAQGAFNSSSVETGNGDVVRFDKCKIGRFKTSGSQFEVVGVGLNNIWGFVIDREGDKWIQEANDLGYSLVPFEHGRSYPGIGMDRLHAHSPWHPPYADFRMGGTGLSGLALSQDGSGFPSPWDETFFLANPIKSSVQSVRAQRVAAGDSSVSLTRVPDLLVSDDKNFRPIAVHFGPDRCLYIVDWYNPVISHNEVPRDHPDRDRTSSRIWRIRHTTQLREAPIDVTGVADVELVHLLGCDSTVSARAAWHQIVDRDASGLGPALRELALDRDAQLSERVLAMWCIGDLAQADARMVEQLLLDGERAMRREAVRVAGTLELTGDALAELLQGMAHEQEPAVRLACLEVLAEAERGSLSVIGLALQFLRDVPSGPTVRLSQNNEEVALGVAGDVQFERSQLRAMFERAPEALITWVDSESGAGLGQEQRLFALLAAGTLQAARRLAPALLEVDREPTTQELSFLAKHAAEPEVRDMITSWISNPQTREAGVRMLLDASGGFDVEALAPTIVSSVRALRSNAKAPELLLRAARELRLAELEPDVVDMLDGGAISVIDGISALVELECTDAELFNDYAVSSLPGKPERRLAASALAGIGGDEAWELLLELWPALDRSERRACLGRLTERRESAARLVASITDGDVALESVDMRTLERLAEHLGEDEALDALLRRAAEAGIPVLRLTGATEDYVDTNVTLSGAFTFESWVRLDEGIGNADGLLSAPGVMDFNFYGGIARLWLAQGGDVIVATRAMEAERWTHLALTRDINGRLALYLNGELDVAVNATSPDVMEGLDVGRTTPGSGTAGWLAEYRVWNVARSAAQIGESFGRSLTSGSEEGLVLALPGSDAALAGSAKITGVMDGPPVRSTEDLDAELKKFAAVRALVRDSSSADIDRGRVIFGEQCAACHTVGGIGGHIGPVLDGVGSKGVEGLMRSILTPNAGVEAGYRTLVVSTVAGEVLSGFLVREDADGIVLRRKDREDVLVALDEIIAMRFDAVSLMPEGLLDGMADGDVACLFGYLLGL
ncbi:MAG: putative membrane-bound dehydrogenase-like protein [Planctomycetota bacterium]|jgi:putative membrane-bound dehydrogenase-like protein